MHNEKSPGTPDEGSAAVPMVFSHRPKSEPVDPGHAGHESLDIKFSAPIEAVRTR
jgi:hypothetical protein